MNSNSPWKTLLLTLCILALFWLMYQNMSGESTHEEGYSNFIEQLRAGEVKEFVIVGGQRLEGAYRDKRPDGTVIPQDRAEKKFRVVHDAELIREVSEKTREYNESADKEFTTAFAVRHSNQWFAQLLPFGFVLVLFVLLWFFFMRQMQAGGNRAMSFGKAKARLNTEGQTKVTFDDVAGCDEAKEELREVVEFLKDPKRFQRLGGKIPKGVLLFGSPGTGKTLLARAVAGEANVPFFSISGSEFVEMFVGVGASRVRDLFEQGKKSSPCIIFMDEIDAVGRYRFAGIGGGNDEREQTLNQLLVEMDGFTHNDEVIIIAATNRPDVLDPALLRPGRFDRRITILPPDMTGRKAILKVHTKNVVMQKEVDLESMAKRSPGFSGADLANAVNEAALLAARRNKDAVDMKDFEEAFDRVMAGPEMRSRRMNDRERKITAYHEAGHALLQHLIEEVDPLHKVTILPRGRALGYSMSLPAEDRYNKTKKMLLGEICVMLGGRIAEELTCGDITTGAKQDIEVATEQARKMVCEYGMSDRLGPLAFGRSEPGEVFLGRDLNRERNYSEEIASEIDKEVRSIIDNAGIRAREMLEQNLDKLHLLANALLEREVMDGVDLDRLFDGTLPPFEPDKDDNAPASDKPATEAADDERRVKDPPLGQAGESPAFG